MVLLDFWEEKSWIYLISSYLIFYWQLKSDAYLNKTGISIKVHTRHQRFWFCKLKSKIFLVIHLVSSFDNSLLLILLKNWSLLLLTQAFLIWLHNISITYSCFALNLLSSFLWRYFSYFQYPCVFYWSVLCLGGFLTSS